MNRQIKIQNLNKKSKTNSYELDNLTKRNLELSQTNDKFCEENKTFNQTLEAKNTLR